MRIDVTGGKESGAVLQNLAGWSNSSTDYLMNAATGDSYYHNNLSPVIAAYKWRRIA